MRRGFAVVGMSCRYPDADNPSQLWENVLAQRRAFRRLPSERLNLDDYLSDDRADPDKTYCGKAAVLQGWEFDRGRFRVAGPTFRSADMAHWLALEVAADALADAGFPDGHGLPNVSTGVLVGNSLTGEFSRANLMRLRWPYVVRVLDAALQERDWTSKERGRFLGEVEQSYKSAFPPVGDETLAGGLSNTIAGRICNHFDLHGGGYTVDGACASSLLSVANACSSLAAEDTDVMLAGGVDLSLDPFELIGFAKVGALAVDQMRVFDRKSAGFWPGEGCGFVVLMREQDAIDQRRKIYAVIRGWGISSDGSGGITRPETGGQQLCLHRAYRRAGYGADSVGYFEGHGTGTTVGDSTELQTISRARLDHANSHLRPAVVGSIKANIGHTKAAAGVAGLIKAAMSIDRQLIPPTTGWETPSPVIDQEGNVLELLHESKTWCADAPIRVGVNGMGFGGINAHLTLEGVAQHRHSRIGRDAKRLTKSMQDSELFLLAADTRSELNDQVERLLGFAARISQAELGDLAAEVSRRLRFGKIRAATTVSTPEALDAGLGRLSQWLADESEPLEFRWDEEYNVALGGLATRPKIGFLFPGQGFLPSIDGGIWRRRFEQVEDIYQRAALPDAVDLVETRYAQKAIVAAELAGTRLLEVLGVHADVAIGHSLGELSAYHWAGAYDADTLLRLAAHRGKVMADHGRRGGAMAGIAANIETVHALVAGGNVAIAAINAPTQTVISGTADAVKRIVEHAKEQGFAARLLSVSHAFHSPLMADTESSLRDFLDGLELNQLNKDVLSTISGNRLHRDSDLRALLLQQLTSPVRFSNAICQCRDVEFWIEIGPGHVLSGLAKQSVDAPVVSVDSSGERLHGLLQTIGVAFALGINVRHQALFDDRFTRPFDWDWAPKFLANPCERAPVSHTRIETAEIAEEAAESAEEASPSPIESESLSPLECIRELAAQRAELPVESVKPADRLLNELHLSSIAVGQLVVDATRQLGLSPPAQPTDAANATVQDIADYLQQRLEQASATTPAGRRKEAPSGVESWTREFVVRLEPRQRGTNRTNDARGDWKILSGGDDPLTTALEQTFADDVAGSGVVVCLPQVLGKRQFDRLLEAARLAIRAGSDDRLVVVQRHRDLLADTGVAPFVRSFHLEFPDIVTRVVSIDDSATNCCEAAEWIAGEATGSQGHREAYYELSGTRREPVWSVLRDQPADDIPLDRDDVLLVTGGGKGITAECALALARDSGVRLGLLGRAPADGDEALRKNLERMESEGISLLYIPTDVTDEESVATAVTRIEEQLGPVTGVIHGAGTNVPQGIATLDAEAFANTLAPKVGGLRNVLREVDAEQLRLLVTFGSIIAPIGLRGQADYAVANELMAQATDAWGREHTHCHALCLQWSVWAGVGMGETLGAVESLRREGISAISVDEGIRILKQAISQSRESSRVIVSGRFGSPPTIQFADSELPLMRFMEFPRVHTPGVELVVDAKLSMQTDPYLRDHVYQGAALLPAVIGMEAMVQAATAAIQRKVELVDAPLAIENVELLRPVVVPEEGETEIRIAALARDNDTVDVVLRTSETDFHQDHFRARVGFDRRPPRLLPTLATGETPQDLAMDGSRVYGEILFHQGRFQRVQRYLHLSATECIAEVDPYAGDDWFGMYLPPQMLLGDPASRDAIIHCIQACIPHGTLLPIAVERVVIGPRDQRETRVHAKERFNEGDEFVYDIDVTQSGVIVEQWQGLRLRLVSRVAPSASWPWQLLVPYIERHANEYFGESSVSVRISAEGSNGQSMADQRVSDPLIAAAAGVEAVPRRRPDGKPEVRGGRSVSATHCGELTMAVASGRRVACDVEHVGGRDPDQWKGLLGEQRFDLAKLISRSTPEDLQTSATRTWCATECLIKAGLSARDPLTLDEAGSDGWVTLRSGSRRIASWVWSADGDRMAQVFAILIDPAEEVIACDLLNTST